MPGHSVAVFHSFGISDPYGCLSWHQKVRWCYWECSQQRWEEGTCSVCSPCCCRDAQSPRDSHCGALMASLRALQGDKTRSPVLQRQAGCLALADFVVPEGTGKGRLEIGKFSTHTTALPQLGAVLNTVKLRLPISTGSITGAGQHLRGQLWHLHPARLAASSCLSWMSSPG